jgi:nucleoid DNA-binding protein
MTQEHLLKSIAEETGLTIKDCSSMLKSFATKLNEGLAKGENLRIPGFGTFSVKERSARVGRNPKDGSELKIPAKRIVKFKSSKEQEEMVAGNKAKASAKKAKAKA